MRIARKDAARRPWVAQLLERKPMKIATVGLANKTARIVWAVMAQEGLRGGCSVTAVLADR
jgi:transposase